MTRSTSSGGSGPNLAGMRRTYDRCVDLAEEDLAGTWVEQFERWLMDAIAAELPEPNAMIVGTAAPNAVPSARTVLLKSYDERGFVFFTNYGSRKGTELSGNPYASLVFPWFPMQRQVVVAGRVERVERAETEAYFATRPRASRLGAWASPQSRVVADRGVLDDLLADVTRRFEGQDEIPAPPDWGGLRVRPATVEFWQGRVGRSHDRLRYRQVDGAWALERLGP